MRKMLLVALVMVSVIALSYGYSFGIAGQCSNCHTMHYSQNGTRLSGWGTSGPYDYLLTNTCVGCHSTDTASATNTSTGAPAVLHTAGPSTQGPGQTLAGGDFYWVVNGQDSYGHNVADLGVGQDSNIGPNLGYNPPGWDPLATPDTLSTTAVNSGGATWSSQLTCAGTNGCHGLRDAPGFDGLRGAHHSNEGVNDQAMGTTLGDSFRFLAGIKGLEDSDWQWTASATDHNEYYGVHDTSARNGVNTYSDKQTISYFCAECHGIFHSDIDVDDPAASAWRRHPTDIVLPNSGEYSAYTSYSIEAPVARPTVPATASGTVSPGDAASANGAIVMCLSCHRAHGSDQPDLLRWKYADMIAGGGGTGGCFTCHTTKN